MNNNFDNDAESTTDEEYSAFVKWLSALAVAELRRAGTDVALQKQVLCRYYKRGERANLTPSELIDFLAVSGPCTLEDAGYSNEKAVALMQISDSLTDDDIAHAVL